MNVIRCADGHYFDRDKYETCPHCGKPAANEAATPKQEPTSKTGGLHFPWWEKPKKPDPTPPPIPTPPAPHPQPAPSPEKPVSPMPETPKTGGGTVTIDVWGNAAPNGNTGLSNPIPEQPVTAQAPAGTGFNIGGYDPNTGIFVDGFTLPPKDNPGHVAGNTLTKEIDLVSANTQGKTMSYFGLMATARAGQGQESSPSQNASQSNPVQNPTAPVSGVTGSPNTAPAPVSAPCSSRPGEPVTGWLVAVGGPHWGEALPIYSGMNTIGRNASNGIVLAHDNAVSREKHALLTFEPKHRKFYLAPGGSSGLTYLNNDFITETKLIQDRDIIEIGSSKLMLVVLCNETFAWEDHIEK